jgi:hypothetical protein
LPDIERGKAVEQLAAEQLEGDQDWHGFTLCSCKIGANLLFGRDG